MIIRSHLETNVTHVCQNKCVACNHAIPVQEPYFADPAIIERDLKALAPFLHCDRYNTVGGEPTLHPQILDIIKIIRDSGITDSIEITTNGQACERWPDAIYTDIDELIVTPYKLTDEQKTLIQTKCMDFGTSLQWHPVIFTEYAYKQPASEDVAFNRYKSCWYNVNRHVIDNGYFYRCCTAPFIPHTLLGLPKETDGIAIEGLTEDKLKNYLFSDQTPKSCAVCASNCGKRIDWKETSRDKWLEESIT